MAFASDPGGTGPSFAPDDAGHRRLRPRRRASGTSRRTLAVVIGTSRWCWPATWRRGRLVTRRLHPAGRHLRGVRDGSGRPRPTVGRASDRERLAGLVSAVEAGVAMVESGELRWCSTPPGRRRTAHRRSVPQDPTKGGCMFTAIYRWRLKPGMEEQFVEGWQRVTAAYTPPAAAMAPGSISARTGPGWPTHGGRTRRHETAVTTRRSKASGSCVTPWRRTTKTFSARSSSTCSRSPTSSGS